MSEPFQVRPMSAADLSVAIEWAEEEGWNPGQDDRDAFLAADPNGFLMGFSGKTPVTSISAVAYDNAFGFIGFYICRPEWRGKGYGLKTWNAALDYLGERMIGLDGVLEQQENYRKSGFKLAHRNIRFAGQPNVATPMDARITVAGQGLISGLLDYDRHCFPAARTSFMTAWLSPSAASRKAFAFIEDGTIKGFGAVRQCGHGAKIGPLFADTPEIADLLFRTLAGQARNQEVVLDVPEPNAAGMALAERYELSPTFETARMYKPGSGGTAPALPLDRIFGITTFELG